MSLTPLADAFDAQAQRDFAAENAPKRSRFDEFEQDLDVEHAVRQVRAAGAIDYTALDKQQQNEMKRALNQKYHDRLEIREGKYGSTVFTKRAYKRNEVIATYRGTDVSEAVADKLPNHYDKVVPSVTKGNSLVGDVIPKGRQHISIATLVNDPGYGLGLDKEHLNPGNVELAEVNGKIKMVAKTNIAAGAELGMRYGYGYWQDTPGYYPSKKAKEEARREWTRMKNKR